MSERSRADTDLDGRTILITGASRGIGRAVAVACASAGAMVVACGRDVAALERLADEVEAGGNVAPLLLPINLENATLDDYATVADHLEDRCGGLDGLVLNAGVLGELSPLLHYDAMTWARVFQVNVHSAFLLLQACQPLLLRAERASIVFTLAAEGLKAKPNWGAYAVSNYALRGLMEVCAGELRGVNGIHVTAVVPPPTDTRLWMSAFPAVDRSTLASASALAPLYVELLGERGAAHHGEVVDAGSGNH